MGCDIHLHCEYKDDDGWHNCDNHVWNDKTKSYEFEDLYWGRNYDLFGILAGVRSNQFTTIDTPRGLPDNISAKTKEFADGWRDCAHSYSYLTMRDLLRWKKRQTRRWKKLKKKHEIIKSHDWYGDYILDDEYPVYKEEHHMLDYLIELLKVKMDNYFYCFNSEDFRIIFWFDS